MRHVPLACWLLAASLPGAAVAQAAAPQRGTPPERPAFEGYQPFADQPVGGWRQLNDTVGAIGGWRAYAREAAGEAPAAAPAPSTAAPRAPAPAPAPASGHGHGSHRHGGGAR